MRSLSSLLRSAVIAVLVLAVASVTAAAAVRGNATGTATAPGQLKKPPATPTTPTEPATPSTPPTPATPGAPAAHPVTPAPETPPGQAKNRPAGGNRATAPTPVPAAGAPVLGRSMTVTPVDGRVRVRLPESPGYVSLDVAGSVPSGAVVDARRGTLTLRSAVDTAGHVQTATVRGAVFEVRQAANAHGLTDLVLRGGPQTGCRSAAARSAAVDGRVTRPGVLWARDSHGRFRTRGRNSVATVRGTIWSTRETCAGTVTRVMEGAVDVQDLRAGRTVTVRAGHAYLARR
jgi:hypothetical protein